MRIKIVSDGTANNTKIIDIKTGKQIENVYAITWHMDGRNDDDWFGTATIVFKNIPVELEAELASVKEEPES